jgi:hypothetical protein
MPRFTRKPAALLAALVLILPLLAAPVAHAAPAAADTGPAAWWHALWRHLAGFWPGPVSGGDAGDPAGPVSLFAPEGVMMDPDGTPQAPPPEGSSMDPDGAPGPASLFAPAGSDMDPDGTPGATAPEGVTMDPNGSPRTPEGGMMDPNG